MVDYLNISTFLIGISTAFFTIFSIHILAYRKRSSRFHTLLGVIMAIWAVWSFKDIILTFPGMYRKNVLYWIMIIDGWSALTYMVFVFEVTMPGWLTWRNFMAVLLPFVAFTIAYGILSNEIVIYCYSIFLWCFAWSIVIVGYVKAMKQIKYIRRNFSNIDYLDVSWLKPVLAFAVVSQLSWLVTSFYATVLVDIIYYITTIILWLMVLHYSWRFTPITVPAETVAHLKGSVLPFSDKEFVEKVVGLELYLDKNLTLADLARCMKTNRTYITQHLSQVRNQSFYDFINQLRIEKKSIPLMYEHPEYTLDYVASESGFSSMSTFRRAFQKFTGKNPSEFNVMHNS